MIDATGTKHKCPYLCHYRDMREMKNLLSKLRETMPLPLKNQGKIGTEHFTFTLITTQSSDTFQIFHKVEKIHWDKERLIKTNTAQTWNNV